MRVMDMGVGGYVGGCACVRVDVLRVDVFCISARYKCAMRCVCVCVSVCECACNVYRCVCVCMCVYV